MKKINSESFASKKEEEDLEKNHFVFQNFNMYGWRPSPTLSDDENYMDICMLITRSSNCHQGSMGCIIVKPSSPTSRNEKNDDLLLKDESNTHPSSEELSSSFQRHTIAKHEKEQKDDKDKEETIQEILNERIFSNILGISTNKSLFKENSSDIHAEIGALGDCLQRKGQSSTRNCTAYVTMPPCKNCFGALYSAGIKRIITLKHSCNTEIIVKAASKNGMQLSSMGKEFSNAQKKRIDNLICVFKSDNNRMNGSSIKDSAQVNTIIGNCGDEELEIVIKERKRSKRENQERKQLARLKKNAKMELPKLNSRTKILNSTGTYS